MTKKLLSLLVCLSLLLSMIVLPVGAEATTSEVEAAATQEEFEIVGEWLWASTVYDLGTDGANIVVERCAKMGITDLYLLVKGTNGTLAYLNTEFTNVTYEDRDILQEVLDAAHAKGIRVHAWVCNMEDKNYKTNNPEAGMWHYVRERDNNRINPYDEGYQTYMTTLIGELVTNYDIDGLHLDYIRYNHACNGWSETDFANLEAMGANIERVKELIETTFYGYNGGTADSSYIFNAYEAGDADALLIAEYRRNNIRDYAEKIIAAAKAANPDIIINAALQPEGAYDLAFEGIHYGQNYEMAAELYDYVCPMAYTSDFGKQSEWMATVAEAAMEAGNKVVMGLQSYYPLTSTQLMSDIEAVRALLPNENVLGVAHFRHSQFGYAKFTYNYGEGDMDLELINTNATGYKWVIVEAAEGVTITGATYGAGMDASAPIVVAEDGSSVMLGYDPAEEGYVLPGLGEGSVNITFEGQPTDPNARIAVARIYITNESRAYNVYEQEFNVDFVNMDGTVIDSQNVLAGEAATAPYQPLNPGYVFTGWDTEYDEVYSDLTVTAQYKEATQLQDVSDFEVVGEWIWGETVYSLGADAIVERCAKNGITDIYLLTKGTGGKLSYLKTEYTDSLTRTDRDVLQETIDAAHAVGIRVHAWLVTVEDALYKANNPDAGLWHYVRGRDNNRINPYDDAYQQYMANVVTEIVTGYDVDGIHLDYIRYNHLSNGWSEADFLALEEMGADIDVVKFLIEKTFGYNGYTADSSYIFEALRNGDANAELIAQYRRKNIVDFATLLRDAAKTADSEIIFSAALMPEGGVTEGSNDTAFADLHYGQNYEDAVELYDYVCPMAYSASYGEDSAWLAEIAQYAIELGNEVVMGLQSYYPLTSDQLMSDIEAVRDLLPLEGLLGIVHFRHTQFSYAKFNYDSLDKTIDVDIINTNATGYKWVIVEIAEGLTITEASYGAGFNADAPIVIAEDGSSVMFGYDPAESGLILPGMGEGTLHITYEGTQVNADDPIALARIYITNESRAYNVYNDVTTCDVTFLSKDGEVIETQTVAYGESATAPSHPVVAGYVFTGWDTDFTNVTADLTVTAQYKEATVSESYSDFEIVGEWIWGETVYSLGADTVVERCAKNGITDIYLLTKGTGGKLSYLKTQYTDSLTRTDRDVLQETIDAAHAAGIRVHAWLVTVEDALYKANNPEAGLWHYVRGRDNNRITPYDEGYQTYMSNIVTEIVSGYDVDGIHLDYIRYNHLANGWSEQDFANLEAMGANIENVKYLINKTLYADKLPEGETVDSQYIFNALRNGDPDALLIAEYRRNNIVDFATLLRDAAKTADSEIIFSAALMPEGGVTEGSNDTAFADLHYGQNYEDAVELYDYVCPMAYSASYGEDSAWLAQIAQYAVELGNEVVMGLQSYYPLTSEQLMSDIEAVRDLLPLEGLLGIVHFRHTQFSYAKFNYDYNAGSMTVDVINTNATGYKWVIVEIAEGLTITGASYGSGFNADAPIVIAEDGSSVMFGYDPAESGTILPGMGEGTLNITFEGTQVNADDSIALARVYITNESRAYNCYNDLTAYCTCPFTDVEDNKWYRDEICYVYENGIMKGVSETTFNPNGITNRAMMVTTLYRMAGSPSVEGMEAHPFTDVVAGSYYEAAVIWGYNTGVIKGTSSTTFSPYASVTREQAATFLYRYSEAESAEASLEAYPDVQKVSKFAKEAIAWAVSESIINGNIIDGVTLLDPQGTATRAQLAAMLARYCQG